MRADEERAKDVVWAIDRIQRYASSQDAFMGDELVQVWVLYHLSLIGEAVRSMSPEYRDRDSAQNWSGWIGLRNVVVHQYFRIHPEMIWGIVEGELPALKLSLENLSITG